jgi:tRNA U34 5-methylaminomethyl-2-thiouridine-forming methyltransferase MnmC
MEYSKELSENPIVTADGSHTLLHPVLNQHYHSLQGSVQESEHIFIELGLRPLLQAKRADAVKIFEMGFGTGLNALLAWRIADTLQRPVAYTGIEAYPVAPAQSDLLNYEHLVGKSGLHELHRQEWGKEQALSDYFVFRKVAGFLESYLDTNLYDCIFFDAFSPSSQPELWTVDVFRKMASILREGGSLVTYSSKGSVRRALEEAGFAVEKHPGPGRKREVVRAIRR